MKNSTTQNIVDLLQQTKLSHIVERANLLNNLNTKVQQRLPQAYKGLYRISNLVDNTLMIEVQNATIKNGLQLQKSTLLTLIRIDFPNVTDLSFRINPNF
ncbi:DciA family protein [Phocoenobacter skyensis]|uniref:DciA family protein n=1 Tax=Phocoenobacter skyensis TaxID=97481 RepID=A0A1H7W6Y4_9PAST|nr:DciA family protein [Pasteurella skyensis]MDP8079124.1 DciA family protein [Pasteurella skyensis]MDP8085074.1 DciA family protein [Pasteurella skyensis]MDP8185031.1 DciA family protein [Pasteurella skyensis]QLB23083.1 hypothetical protein A6B44_07655 [Pasteurella skyensis]SEM16849.1 Protein of unknown function [Pasteurella skyensis]